MSTKPGVTRSPVASMVSAASPSSGAAETATITPSFTAMSPTTRGAPVPSTIVPLVILTSYMKVLSGRIEIELDLGAVDAVHERVGEVVDRTGDDPDGAHAAHELLEEQLDLEPGQRGSQAEVRAEPEGDVVVGRAGDVVALGVDEVRGVAVGRGVH